MCYITHMDSVQAITRFSRRKTTPSTGRLSFIPLANVIAALSVLYLHVNGGFWSMGIHHPQWFSANIIECVFYFAVPVFVMTSGATLLDFFDRYGLGIFFWRRIQKTVIPYIYFSILAIPIYIWKGRLNPDTVTGQYIASGLISGSLGPNYWFFPLIFCVYLSIPLFAAIRQDLRKKVFIYLAGAGFLLNILYPFANTIFSWGMPGSISVALLNGYLIYIPMGYLVAHYKFKWPFRLIIYVVGLGGLFLHIYMTYTLSMDAGQMITIYKGYLNAPCVAYSVAIFLGIRYLGERVMKVKRFSKVIMFATTTTLAIYMIHQYLLEYFAEVVLKIDITNLAYRLIMPWALFLVICIPVHFLQKLDGFKYILPK